MKKNTSISTKISIAFSIITLLVGLLFYFLLPDLLNYPPDTINTQFDKEVSKLYYIYQYLIALGAIIILSIVLFKVSLRDIDNWVKNKDKTKIKQIREICFKYPFKLFVIIEMFPVAIVLLTLMLTGSHPVILLFKIGILIFSFATLVSSMFLIISKKIFYPILKETSQYAKREENQKRGSFSRRLVFQIFPSVLVTALLIALIGYSRLIVEKGTLLNKYYMAELKTVSITSQDNIIEQIQDQIGSKLLSDNDYIFVELPSGEIISSNSNTPSDFFIKYIHELSSSHNNRVYEAYTIDEQGVIDKIIVNGIEYTIGIHYEIVASSLLTYFILSAGLLFIFNIIILGYVTKSIKDDLINITEGMKGILANRDKVSNNKLPVTSNDIVGELVTSFNDIQGLTMQNIEKIHENQSQLVEQERLATLGQMIGGIAHNLKTPIMSIAGAIEALQDLTTELDNSIGNPVVTNEDFHDIAKDYQEWIEKIKDYTEYMSDVITAVKGQAVNLSSDAEANFTIEELFKRVNILMKHELKNAIIYLNVTVNIDENLIIKGDVNILVQVINNMISNSIQAYNGKTEQTIKLNAYIENGNIIITVQDFASGLPEKVKDKLFKEMITTKGKNGTGLGLYMSYSTIRAHFNGTITVQSEEGKGTKFYIILPL